MDVLNAPTSIFATTGFSPSTSASTPLDSPALSSNAGPAASDLSVQSLLSLRNPLTIFGLFAAVTFGLIAVSSTVRVGKTKAKASVGKE